MTVESSETENDLGPEGSGSQSRSEHDAPVVHEYDGIEECDHKLPNWWLWLLYGTVIFGFFYWFHFQVFNSGKNPGQVYAAEAQAQAAAEAAKIKAAGVMDDASLLALAKDQKLVAQGKDEFVKTCAQCHTPTGGGNIGPNLTDNAWLYGGAPEKIYKTVAFGTKNGMPEWLKPLGIDRVQAVVAYVITIRNTNVAGGKAPQGQVE